MAFVTRETMQGKGMAKLLLTTMIDIAKRRGIKTMVALVKRQNKPMLNVFESAGFTQCPSDDIGEVELALSLEA